MWLNRLFLKSTLLFLAFSPLCAMALAEQFIERGYGEIEGENHAKKSFDSLYGYFDDLIDFLQKNPAWAQKLYAAKERFIRSKAQSLYSTNVFGFYDESHKESRRQIAFYYSTHFHEFIRCRYPEFNQVAQMTHFLQACEEIEKPCPRLFERVADQMGLQAIFSSECDHPPVLLKVIKYLPSYRAQKPHYDGALFSFFLDSTNDQSLLLSPYKLEFSVEDFFSPKRSFSESSNPSILIIPGAFLTDFSINPTPHIVVKSDKARYATIAFAMRPNYKPYKIELAPLPSFVG